MDSMQKVPHFTRRVSAALRTLAVPIAQVGRGGRSQTCAGLRGRYSTAGEACTRAKKRLRIAGPAGPIPDKEPHIPCQRRDACPPAPHFTHDANVTLSWATARLWLDGLSAKKILHNLRTIT